MDIIQTEDLVREGQVPVDLAIEAGEGEILQRLAARVAELASQPVEQEKLQLWYDHNELKPTRPVIFCDPENGWNEIILPEQLECQNPLPRSWELTLRKEIFWGAEMGDDRVVEPCFSLPHVYAESDWGMHEVRVGGEQGGAYRWEAPLQDYAAFDRLHYPRITLDTAATQKRLDLAREILGDLLEVRLRTAWWWSLGMTWTLVNLRGLERMMYDMVDAPDDLHRMMGFLRDGYLARLQSLEQHGLLSLNNDGTYVGSGGFGWTHELPQPDFTGRVRPIDMWGFGESQETVAVSPGMFAEFIFPYQLSILERFGLNCYGCCEPLDSRWHVVEKIPRLRRVSISAWANIPKMAERLGDRYIFSMKPAPSDLALPSFEEDYLRLKLRQAFRDSRGCRVEAIMKDNNTIRGDPQRVMRWVQIARQEAENI
jgi:hypothetical protein